MMMPEGFLLQFIALSAVHKTATTGNTSFFGGSSVFNCLLIAGTQFQLTNEKHEK